MPHGLDKELANELAGARDLLEASLNLLLTLAEEAGDCERWNEGGEGYELVEKLKAATKEN